MKFRKQQGMTMLGMLILIAFVGLFVFAGLRLVPIYLEHMKIEAVLGGVVTEFDGQSASPKQIFNYIEKRFDVESVRVIRARDIEINKVDDAIEVAASYSNTTPFVANVSFTVDFDERVEIRR
ncbi:MAG: DUF4845 domain-containing protein [Pseudomonadota bacterium]